MNSPRLALRIASVLLALFTTAHVFRALIPLELRLEYHEIPAWVSYLAALITAPLTSWMWWLSTRAPKWVSPLPPPPAPPRQAT
jgi:hypothetical protein